MYHTTIRQIDIDVAMPEMVVLMERLPTDDP